MKLGFEERTIFINVNAREAEFQAWKRRKDYDPLAAAR